MKEYTTINIVIKLGNLTVELTNGIIKINDVIVELLVHEYKILSLLSRADINSWVSIEDIAKNLNLDNSFISNCIPNLQKKLSKHKSTVNIIESLTGEYIRLGYDMPDIYKNEFDESSKEIHEKEEFIDELRYQIRRDMEDYKLLLSNQAYLRFSLDAEDTLDYINIFGNLKEGNYNFYKKYLIYRIEDNIQKLRDINKC